MIRRCREAGLPVPASRVTDGFAVMLRRRSGAVGPGKTSVKTAERIVELMREEPEISLKEIAARLGKTLRAVELQANILKSDERIGRIGPAKGDRGVVLK